ncbi:hypothetical protein ADN00_10150 [Ornatilinea apprima]|uniref:DUF5655 domain-containing protein n=1 Tax=Ornatilinea apprima TaxID=1134406 RepID=A0A0P6XL52_9CHLR|nr:DUF5655 domain-containing protein [Ornatilinea apprima]KPL76943.1 hypothetical protein ADN00_10150 [Ornatilinea apprima]
MPAPTLDEFFNGFPASRPLFDALLSAAEELGEVELTVQKSQIVLRRARPFAWVWVPGRYLRGRTAPLVLSLSFPAPDPSPRWKEIVQVSRARFMHHLELRSAAEIDAEVRAWLRQGWQAAGRDLPA